MTTSWRGTKSVKQTSAIGNANNGIAVVGIGCRYPGANNPKALWENVLLRRGEFRRFIDVRLPVYDYYNPDRSAPDKIYMSRAAYIDGFDFDWAKRRIPQSTYHGTDIVQWLALDVAEAALEDAGYTKSTVPRDRTGVILGNTLTGEQSRASSMRLRWPFVKKVLEASGKARGLTDDVVHDVAQIMEQAYKSVFPTVNEDTLQGGLSNTIAGRVCNYFDLHGGGYIVDGACSSSLLAVCTAATYLIQHDWDVALAGGVDVSLDTFELIGFAKTGALSAGDMNVYDQRGAGFIPGEGCGIVVLKRIEDAVAAGDTIYAVLRGWGVSTDGKGGITAPTRDGQALAIARAYDKAGYTAHDLDFIEGHGTGTSVGDRTELEGVASAMQIFGEPSARSCGMTSFKSIVGHTKAAAGIGAFIKATLAVNRRVLPPTAGCEQPHQVFEDNGKCLFPIIRGQVLDPSKKVRAGVSAMGFGGINSHVTIESWSASPELKLAPSLEERTLLASSQDTELFVVSAATPGALREKLLWLSEQAQPISVGEMPDLAAHLTSLLSPHGVLRAALIARLPNELAERASVLADKVGSTNLSRDLLVESEDRTGWLGGSLRQPRLGFLFPGQGSQQLGMGRVLVERYDWAQELLARVDKITNEESGVTISGYLYGDLDKLVTEVEKNQRFAQICRTEIAQPAICFTSMLYMRYLGMLGIKPHVVGGHSLGELTALYAAGAYDDDDLIRYATIRGHLMSLSGDGSGAMASISTSSAEVQDLIQQVTGFIDIANINSPRQTVITGDSSAVHALVKLALEKQINARVLPVSGAFHSPRMQAAADVFRNKFDGPRKPNNLVHKFLSCMDAQTVTIDTDLCEHFSKQILEKVNFIKLIDKMRHQCDWMIEVGPGRVLSGLVNQAENISSIYCSSVSSKPDMHRDMNVVLAQAFIRGVQINWKELYEKRLVRTFIPFNQKIFIDNPCERKISIMSDGNYRAPIIPLPGSVGVTDNVESIIAEECGIDNGSLRNYIARRKRFIADIINADIKSSFNDENRKIRINESEMVQDGKEVTITNGPAAIEKISTWTSSVVRHPEKSVLTVEKENIIESILMDLVTKRTGFSQQSFTLQSRLLDDLNLDSIKAGALIAAAAKQAGVAGKLDPSSLANATLREIATAIGNVSNLSRPEKIVKVAEAIAIADIEISEPLAQTIENDFIDKLIDLAAQRTGFPRDSLTHQLRLLDDLNLDSIKAGELIAAFAKQSGVAGKLDPSTLANATLVEIAQTVSKTVATQIPSSSKKKSSVKLSKPFSKTIDASPSHSAFGWVRNFSIDYFPKHRNTKNTKIAEWVGGHVIIVADGSSFNLVTLLDERLTKLNVSVDILDWEDISKHTNYSDNGMSSVIGIFPQSASKSDDMIEVSRMVGRLHRLVGIVDAVECKNIATIQFGGGRFGESQDVLSLESCGSVSFLRSLSLERADTSIRVIDLDIKINDHLAVDCILAELNGAETFAAAGYDANCQRLEPEAVLQQPFFYTKPDKGLDDSDIVLITAGAKGITAECALALAKKTNAKFALVGSSIHHAENTDSEIGITLSRFIAGGHDARYYRCDLKDYAAVSGLIKRVADEMGPISVVVHGAGLNTPRLVGQVEEDQALEEIAPKLQGAINLCRALRTAPPRMFIGISSIIGITGMAGNAWYAFSNEVLHLVLRNFKKQFPSAYVLAVAYSVWAEAGMGKRLNVIQSLEKSGVGAISNKEGTERFVQLALTRPETTQVIVAGPLGGLATWRALSESLPSPQGRRYIESVLHLQPGVEVTASCTLTLAADKYLHDHDFRGSFLFPTVFGLEAMAQAATYLRHRPSESVVRIENVRLERPIVVDAESGTKIEIRAIAEEVSDRLETAVHVTIGTEQTGYSLPHFSATLILAQPVMASKLNLNFPKRPLALNPLRDLYGDLLFQGSLFQRMRAVYSVTKDAVQCEVEHRVMDGDDATVFAPNINHHFVLEDPFFRDVLLQSIQLPLAPKIVLPVGIDRIRIYKASKSTGPGIRRVSTEIISHDDKEFTCTVTVTNNFGEVTERLEGYRVRVVEDLDNRLGLGEQLEISPGLFDEKYLHDAISDMAHALNITDPAIGIDYLPGLHALPKDERHLYEQVLIKRVLSKLFKKNGISTTSDIDAIWDVSGKPMFTTDETVGLDISISHDDDYCICVIGPGPQGCDLEIIKPRAVEDWIALLGESRATMINSMLVNGENINVAATRVWCSVEAARKASKMADVALSVESINGKFVVFKARSAEGVHYVVTQPLSLACGAERIFSLVVYPRTNLAGHTEDNTGDNNDRVISTANTDPFYTESHGARTHLHQSTGQLIYEYIFQPAFKESASLNRGVFFTSYLAWIGKVRELFMADIGARLVSQISSGEWGLVTNWAEVNISGEAKAYDRVLARFRLRKVVGSVIPLTCEFFLLDIKSGMKHIATVDQETTWVRVVGHGRVEPAPYPTYLRDFLDRAGAPPGVTHQAKEEYSTSRSLDIGQLYKNIQEVPSIGGELYSAIFETSLEDANLVGNVYYANYFIWQGRVRDRFLNSIVPELMRGTGDAGEPHCLRSRLDYLRDAMPFDRVYVCMSAKSVHVRGAVLWFQYFRLQEDGSKQKLAIGTHEFSWVKRSSSGSLVGLPLPDRITKALVMVNAVVVDVA